jgi:hypothetical protein
MNYDWPLLREQKAALLTLIAKGQEPKFNTVRVHITDVVELLQGVVHLIDHIQDTAVGHGNATATEVFGELE